MEPSDIALLALVSFIVLFPIVFAGCSCIGGICATIRKKRRLGLVQISGNIVSLNETQSNITV